MKLIVSEKDTTAKRIAGILGGSTVKQEAADGVPVYRFRWEGGDCASVGLKGHILKVDYPEKYNNWQKVDPLELVDVSLVKVVSQRKIVRALQNLAKKASEIVIATDFDREGELIGVEALEKIAEAQEGLPTRRARFSSLTPKEIAGSFSKLEDIYYNLASAGAARQDIDLIWGATLTRLISLASGRLGRQFLSVGRVQSPTLRIIVEREREREAFVPIPYWQVKIRVSAEGIEFAALHRTERFLKEEEAKAAYAAIEARALVDGVQRKEKTLDPPAPFNTTAFLSAAASLGFSPAAAMNIAESLYMEGKISYPRVDNTHYPPALDLEGMAREFLKSPDFRELAELVLAQEKIEPTVGKKRATDHPPIHPTEVVSRRAFGEERKREWKIYELVVRRFLATLAPKALQERVTAELVSGGERFAAGGSRMLSEGWTKCYPYSRKREEELPPLTKGQSLDVVDRSLEGKETQPPGRYGQGSLIEEMEKLGLGTKATRHSIIQNLYERGYIHGDPTQPTKLGRAVVDALAEHAEHITTPQMTAELEESMDSIAEEKAKREEVVQRSRDMLREVVKLLQGKRDKVRETLIEGIREDQVLGSCPNSDHPMRVIRNRATRKRFAGCTGYPECSTSYPLPQNGGIVPLGSACEHCGAPMIKVINKGSRPWTLCINPACPGKEQSNLKKVSEAK